MQKNQLIIVGVIILLLLLGIGGYLVMGKNLIKSENSTSNNTESSKEVTNGMQSSIADLFTSGDTKQCTFDVKATNGGTKGTIYVSGNKAYGDFEMTSDGKTSDMYIIRNDTTFYMWGGSLPSGIKMTMDVDELATKMQGSSNSSFNPNDKVDYSCGPWTEDASKFTPPTNIKFMDASAMMPTSGASSTVPAGSDPCSAISDPASKAACENAMKQR